MFVPHVVVHNAMKKRCGGKPPSPATARAAGLSAAIGGTTIALVQGLTKGHVHGGPIVFGVVVVLLAALVGFLVARGIGRQGKI
jgi:hypothetical protein